MQSEHFLESWVTSSNDDECTLIVRSPGAVFYLQWIPSELARAPPLLADYLKSLEILKLTHDDDTNDDNYQEREAEAEKLKRPFNKTISSLAPNPPFPPFTLHHWLNPEWFLLIATVVENKIKPRREHENPYMLPGEPRHSSFLKKFELDTWVPNWYSSHEVQIMPSAESSPLLSTPTKVLVQGNLCHFKNIQRGSPAPFRELKAHREILKALAKGLIPADLRICRLHGLVYDKFDDYERMVGLLLLHVKTKISHAPSTLRNFARSANQKTRQRWSGELATLVHTLHHAGLQWGDVKPDNILVDEDDNLWLIDFDGGYTPPWVSRENCGKLEGDIEGLKNIQEWLLNMIDKSCG
ncbi:uncharacterized protein PgNI_02354 [Pyricularia grisea]|uniref:Protein kinase domain-containing protein n=1 Tax=Pyricularia grisea TaxID=148305 RepID=A0A6P8BJ17_PYRGI|nr:uncharacterized protein PgNI_02354 [Pyricularia grisea]TLD16644.1 hypothetical protein PgNI_02354 [Pyricularia grisea]